MKNLGQITNAQDVTTKEYVDNLVDNSKTIMLAETISTNAWVDNTTNYYADISISGITASTIAVVSITTPIPVIIDHAECITNAIRIYVKALPTANISCIINYKNQASGTGNAAIVSATEANTATITSNSTDYEIPTSKAVYSLFNSIINANGVAY